MNRRPRWILALLALALTVGCAWPGRLLRGYAEGSPPDLGMALNGAMEAGSDPAAVGLAHFAFDDWGSLNTDGLDRYTVPWKLVATAVVVHARDLRGLPVDTSTLNRILTELGFVTPARVVNWRGPAPTLTRPLGLVHGTMSRGFPRVELEGANVGCVACHSGVLYDGDGRPTREVWVGLPNTSLNLQAYGVAVFEALRHIQGREEELEGALRTLFPEVTEAEWSTIEDHGLPAVRERFAGEWRDRTTPFPFVNGSAGLTNGVGSLKNLVGLVDEDDIESEVGFTSIPDLGGTLLRSSLLYDGTYVAAGRPRFVPMDVRDVTDDHVDGLADVVTFFIVPTLGVEPDRARAGYDGVRLFMEFLRELRSPPFPGRLDRARANRGRGVYDRDCARCHGSYSPGVDDVELVRFPNRLVPQDSMGTDPRRWQAVSEDFVQRVAETAYGPYLDVARTGGYVAPPLTAVWATAPYLHNGSVPTLWHLLNPTRRPARFMVGGHRLDFDLVGIAGSLDGEGRYADGEGYTPWSVPALYDTRRPGMSATGHERQFAHLSEEEKLALMEFLKVL